MKEIWKRHKGRVIDVYDDYFTAEIKEVIGNEVGKVKVVNILVEQSVGYWNKWKLYAYKDFIWDIGPADNQMYKYKLEMESVFRWPDDRTS
jgi:hypothetical protein